MSRRPTLADVAKMAGTSVATASRYLSHSGYPVSMETARRVKEAVAQLDYTPNMVGRMLKKSVSMDVGVMIPTILNPFFPGVVLGIEEEAAERDYGILLCNSHRDPRTEERSIESLLQKQVGGLIISPCGTSWTHSTRLQKAGIPVVTLDVDLGVSEFRNVLFEHRQAGRMAAEHLLKLGHRDIAFLSAPLTRASRRDVLSGLRDVAGDGIRLLLSKEEQEVMGGPYEFLNGRFLTGLFLELSPRPTAIVAVNDMTALGVLQKLTESGVAVPGEVSVIGFDDIEMSRMTSPPLTTVRQPTYGTGRAAAKLLLDMMEGKPGENCVFAPELVMRDTTRNIMEGTQ